MALRKRLLPVRSHKARPDVALAIVNIVLLLILFFMVTGSFTAPRGIEVDLSETGTLPIEALPRPILVIGDDDSLTLNGLPVAAELLEQALDGETVLHVLIDRDAAARRLLAVLSLPGIAAREVRLVTVHTGDPA